MADRKVSDKECAIRLVLKELSNAETGYTKEDIEEVLGARTTQSRIDKINAKVQEQVARCKKLWATYLAGKEG